MYTRISISKDYKWRCVGCFRRQRGKKCRDNLIVRFFSGFYLSLFLDQKINEHNMRAIKVQLNGSKKSEGADLFSFIFHFYN